MVSFKWHQSMDNQTQLITVDYYLGRNTKKLVKNLLVREAKDKKQKSQRLMKINL
jgi:hypothetical protein